MKKIVLSFLTLTILLVAVFSAACNDGVEDLTVTDCAFTSFTAEDFDGNIVDESVFGEYKVTMINVWGTYCSPCKTELPELAELNAEYEDDGFQIIGIPIDANRRTASDAKLLIEETGADYRHLRVSSDLKNFIADMNAVPYTLFVNRSGKQIGKAYMGSRSKAEWKKLIDKILESAN